ncbi:hypothetical protein PENSPDRAFT_758481 [Peniophora sp. CONT]|nr:hypothetical protein PENSPDRAFT_758481 [Peniophora sp. CONT]
MNQPRNGPSNPFLSLLGDVRSTSDRLLQSDDLAARANYSRRLASGAIYFRTLSLEMATRANALAPISRLPREILIMIITIPCTILARIDDQPHPAWRARGADSVDGTVRWVIQKGSLGWVRMTHVCRAWRATLLDARHLWAQNIGVLPKALLTFLERAGPAAPLSIGFRLSPQVCGPSCEALYAPLPLDRVRQMSWSLTETADSTYLHRNIVTLERGLPILETLDIDCDVNPEPRALEGMHHNHFLLPNLRSFNVDRFYVPFTMPNLTELFLHRPPIPMPDILDDLRASTSLNCARFERCRFAPMKSPLALPNLKFLFLDCCDTPENQSVYDLFETFMALPASTKLEIIVGGPSDDSDDPHLTYTEHDMLAVLRFCIRSHARSGTAPNILTLDGNSGDVRLSQYKKQIDVHDPVWHAPWMVGTMLAQISDIDGKFEDMLKMPAAPLVFHFITVLSVFVDAYMSWEVLYEALPNVRALRLDLYSAEDAFDALGRILSTTTEDAGAASTQRILLPRLTFVWVDGDHTWGDWRSDWDKGSPVRESLLRALKTRAEFSAQAGSSAQCVQTLCMQNFKEIRAKGAMWLHELRTVVPVVECIDTVRSIGYWCWDLACFIWFCDHCQ